MSYVSVTTHIPVQVNPQKPDEVSLQSQEIEINLKEVYFIFKAPLDPQAQLIASLPGPLIVSAIPPAEDLEAAGLVSLPAIEGTAAWFNPSKVQFYFTPELGTYVLLFPGGNRLGVKTTNEELRQLLGADGGIIT